MPEKAKLCGNVEINAAIDKIARLIISEFIEDAASSREFALIGIHRQGVPLARRLIATIERQTGRVPELALLDISMYRDDIGMRNSLPVIRETVIPFDVNNMAVILVDDVLSSGRTIRAALDAITDYGRPGLMRLAVLVDRGNREFPIRADYVGMDLTVASGSKIEVEFEENGGKGGIYKTDWHKTRGGNNG